MSKGRCTAVGSSLTPSDFAATSIWPDMSSIVGWPNAPGSHRTATRVVFGTASLSSSSHLPLKSSPREIDSPVRLPPGPIETVWEFLVDSEKRGMPFEWAFLMDALQAERDQGITIDTAQIWFKTKKRDYVIIDAPGHKEFLKNMITGAASADAAVLLIAANEGIREQSKRHGYLLSLLGIRQVVVAVNKMDLVGWSEARFLEIRAQFEEFLPRLDIKDVKFIPMSALNGDNVVDASVHTPWYVGPTLLGHLETVHIASDWNLNGFRLPVQWVNRPNNPTDASLHDFRGFSGQIAGGIVRTGQKIIAFPAGIVTTVKQIWTYDGPVDEAFCPQSVTLVLEHDIDISRGSILVGLDHLPGSHSDLQAEVCWMHPRALQPGKNIY